MATRDGQVVAGLVSDPLACSTKGRFVTIAAQRAELGATIKRRFKLQCTNENAPDGIVTWTNDNGGLQGRPEYPGVYGPTEIISVWVTEE